MKSKMNKILNIIIPRLDFTGPANLAIEIAEVALLNSWVVNIWYLSDAEEIRNDLNKLFLVKKIRLSKLNEIEGIVHTHGFRPDFVGMILGFSAKCKTITTLHGCFPNHLHYDYGRIKGLFLWKIWHIIIKNLNYRICISDSMLKHYCNFKDRVSYILIYNFRSSFIDNAEIDSSANQWILDQINLNKRILVFVGSLSERKGVIKLINNIKVSKSFSLLIIGEGPLKDIIENLSNKIKSIHYVGKVINPTIYIKNSDILVLPSEAEGLPLVILEALSVGVPSLLSSIPVHQEMQNIGAGLTFCHSSFRDFEENAFKLIRSRNPIDDITRKEIFSNNFSSISGAMKYINLYEKMRMEK
jgi:glycosyltransferase involved in cell wall biosynthesis